MPVQSCITVEEDGKQDHRTQDATPWDTASRVHQCTMRGFCSSLVPFSFLLVRFPSIPIRLPTCFITCCLFGGFFHPAYGVHPSLFLVLFAYILLVGCFPRLVQKRVNRLGVSRMHALPREKKKNPQIHMARRSCGSPPVLATEIHFTVQPPSPTFSLLPPNVPRTSSGRLRSGLSTAVLAPF